MRERPILFSGPMVRALLAGTKTQTRRVVKNDRVGLLECEPIPAWDTFWQCVPCPYGQPGDRLWVRETWNRFDAWQGYFYAADDHSFGIGEDDDPDHIPPEQIRWRPSIHMPRAASRITLEITGVRVERLQDISEADAIAEGIERQGGGWRCYTEANAGVCYRGAVNSYRSLWESINGAGSWEANPWVWVVSFTVPESVVVAP